MEEAKDSKNQVLHPEKIETIRQFAVGLGDELNNLLVVISGRLQILEAKQIADDVRDNLITIDNCVNSLRKIVEKIRRFSFNAPLKIEDLDTNKVIEDALILFDYHKSPTTKITAEKDLSQSLPVVKSDLKQLEEAFLLLFLNAKKSMPEGGKLSIRTSNLDNKFVEVRVSDIAVRSTHNLPNKEWLGLDLLICYNNIHNLNGSIEIESRNDQGSTFLIRLPLI